MHSVSTKICMQIEIPATDDCSDIYLLQGAHAAHTIGAVAENSFDGWLRALAAILASQGKEQKDVAQRLGFAASKVSRMMSADQRMTVDELGQILAAFGVTAHLWADWLDMANGRPRSGLALAKEHQGKDADALAQALDIVSKPLKKTRRT